MTRGNNTKAASGDNYTEFIGRLDTAAARLIERRDSQDKALEILDVLLQQNLTGVQSWEVRRRQVEEALAKHSGSRNGKATLRDLQDMALKMESGFRSRAVRIQERVSVLQGRRDEVSHSLGELDRSKVKLTASRILSEERRNLGDALASLAGSSEGTNIVVPDPGLRGDLKEARQAVVLAEALMEVKGK